MCVCVCVFDCEYVRVCVCVGGGGGWLVIFDAEEVLCARGREGECACCALI